jgi:hypothetical protein
MRLILYVFAFFLAAMPNAHSASDCGPYRVPIVVVGDGHGTALHKASNWCWANMSRIGRSIFDPELERQLRSLPSGTPVVISLGTADKNFGERYNWKDFHHAASWIAMIADQQRLNWIWVLPPCLPDQSTDWARDQLEGALDLSQTWDWPYCVNSVPMPRSDVFYTSQIMNIEMEFLRRFRR